MLLGGQNYNVLQYVDAAAEALNELRKLTLGSPHRVLVPALHHIELELREIH
jgi:hypothetical protein